MSTNKSWPPYNKLKVENYDTTKFLLPPDNHFKYIPYKETFVTLSRALRIYIIKYTTFSSSKEPE